MCLFGGICFSTRLAMVSTVVGGMRDRLRVVLAIRFLLFVVVMVITSNMLAGCSAK